MPRVLYLKRIRRGRFLKMAVYKSHTLKGKLPRVKHWEMLTVSEILPFTAEAELQQNVNPDGDASITFPTHIIIFSLQGHSLNQKCGYKTIV